MRKGVPKFSLIPDPYNERVARIKIGSESKLRQPAMITRYVSLAQRSIYTFNQWVYLEYCIKISHLRKYLHLN